MDKGKGKEVLFDVPPQERSLRLWQFKKRKHCGISLSRRFEISPTNFGLRLRQNGDLVTGTKSTAKRRRKRDNHSKLEGASNRWKIGAFTSAYHWTLHLDIQLVLTIFKYSKSRMLRVCQQDKEWEPSNPVQPGPVACNCIVVRLGQLLPWWFCCARIWASANFWNCFFKIIFDLLKFIRCHPLLTHSDHRALITAIIWTMEAKCRIKIQTWILKRRPS